MKNIAIIDAGLGGLLAGNLLARRGHEVTLFESFVLPGAIRRGFVATVSISKAARTSIRR